MIVTASNAEGWRWEVKVSQNRMGGHCEGFGLEERGWSYATAGTEEPQTG